MYINEKVLKVRYVGFSRKCTLGLCMQKAGSDCTQEFCTEYCKYRCGSNYTQKFCTGMGMQSYGRKGTGSFKDPSCRKSTGRCYVNDWQKLNWDV